MDRNEFSVIIEQFQLQGDVEKIIPYGSGHIHETYRLVNANPNLDDYILQKINTNIFGEVEQLMNNIQLVTEHLKRKLDTPDGENDVLTIVPTINGKLYYQDSNGSCWRIFIFLKNTKSYDLIENELQAFEGGRAFGRFQMMLSDLDVSNLFEILPDFHNIDYRYRLFYDAIENNPVGRANDVNEEISFVTSKKQQMQTIQNMGKQGLIPLRTTHNDTKFNNVLLDENDQAKCVIDLDTVMPGYVAYDFGDAIRTIVNTAEEDEKDLDKIQVNMKLFESFANGFLSECASMLSEKELESLVVGCHLLPFIIGLRFLTDYIDGDHYFKIHFPGHNLQRAKAQFCLAGRVEEKLPEMKDMVKAIYLQNIKNE